MGYSYSKAKLLLHGDVSSTPLHRLASHSLEVSCSLFAELICVCFSAVTFPLPLSVCLQSPQVLSLMVVMLSSSIAGPQLCLPPPTRRDYGKVLSWGNSEIIKQDQTLSFWSRSLGIPVFSVWFSVEAIDRARWGCWGVAASKFWKWPINRLTATWLI